MTGVEVAKDGVISLSASAVDVGTNGVGRILDMGLEKVGV